MVVVEGVSKIEIHVYKPVLRPCLYVSRTVWMFSINRHREKTWVVEEYEETQRFLVFPQIVFSDLTHFSRFLHTCFILATTISSLSDRLQFRESLKMLFTPRQLHRLDLQQQVARSGA